MTWSLNTTLCLYWVVLHNPCRMEAVWRERKHWSVGLETEKRCLDVESPQMMCYIKVILWIVEMVTLEIWCCVCTRQVIISSPNICIQSSYYSNTGRKHKFTFNVVHTQYYQYLCYLDYRHFCWLSWIYYLIMRFGHWYWFKGLATSASTLNVILAQLNCY